jgi:hypothetical protein
MRVRVAASAVRRRVGLESSGRTWPFFQNLTSRAELFGTSLVLGAEVGVFSNAKEVVERNVGKVADGCRFGRLGGDAFSDAPARDADWDGKLGLRDWILAAVALDLLLDGLPVLWGVAITVAWVQLCIQFEVRADGT